VSSFPRDPRWHRCLAGWVAHRHGHLPSTFSFPHLADYICKNSIGDVVPSYLCGMSGTKLVWLNNHPEAHRLSDTTPSINEGIKREGRCTYLVDGIGAICMYLSKVFLTTFVATLDVDSSILMAIPAMSDDFTQIVGVLRCPPTRVGVGCILRTKRQ
jgi:hypothetical protein